jgi:undecaprenyl-diphosphatase
MSVWNAIVLGLLQGVTEFLPVSSTGHLVLARTVLQTDAPYGLTFDAVLHFATVLAVIVYFRRDLYLLGQAALRKLGRLPVNRADEQLLFALALATLPAAVAGLFLESYLAYTFQAPLVVAALLVASAVFFMVAEYRNFLYPRAEHVTYRRALWVGVWQILALLPGISRSGITIGAGMLYGMSRSTATRFSFLLAIPLVSGAGLKKILDAIVAEGETVALIPLVVGAVVAFVSALVVVHWFLRFVRTYTLWPFVWYLLVLASFIGFAQLFAV